MAYTWTIENHHVKVFETFLKPGQILPMHSHPPHLRYCYTDGINKHTWKNGSTEIIEDKVGYCEWRDELVHKVENIGNIEIHSLIVEVKSTNCSYYNRACDSLFNYIESKSIDFVPEFGSKFGNVRSIIRNKDIHAYELIVKPRGWVYTNKYNPPTVYICLENSVDFILGNDRNVFGFTSLCERQANFMDISKYHIGNNTDRYSRVLVVELLSSFKNISKL